ncbi:MAG TPA: lipid-binding SYLF domain-containing protein [Vicinamibacterales bacterium]|nr:lipid-binding SYLF domain-containing protein [Vicinamibacterales bacterium]
MKLRSNVVVATLVAALAAISPLIAQNAEHEIKRVTDAATVLDEIMGAADKAVPRSVMEKAEGIAVFPSLIKGGIGIGGQRGHGVISVRDRKTGGWSNPAFLTITGGSVGAQFGLQAIDLVLVINNQRGLEQLVKNQFKVGADAGVAAGPVGREASASTDIQMRAQILSYSRSRGLFAGVTLNGSTIRQDRDANERFYGVGYRTGQIVFDGMGTPVSADTVTSWKGTLKKYAN